jgi:acid phosphatase family membrane protein YuiD
MAWMVAQFTKMLCGFYRTRRVDFSYMVSTGGMPSAHSAMACGLMTAVGMLQGFGSASFVISLMFALVVMFDASTVRRAAGQQARVLNEMADELFKRHRFPQKRLAELLGHTRFEVFMGMVIGILVAIIVVAAGGMMD